MRIVFTRYIGHHHLLFSRTFVGKYTTAVRFAYPFTSSTRLYSELPDQQTRKVKMNDQAPKEEVNLHKDPYNPCWDKKLMLV